MAEQIKKATTLEEKCRRIMERKASYKFRLGALLASDNRPGQVWA